MADGFLIVRLAEIEQSYQVLAVALQRQVAQPVGQRQGFLGIPQSLGIVLSGPQMFAGPIPHQHVQAVFRSAVACLDEAVGQLLAVEQSENLVGRGDLFSSVLTVIDF